MMAATWQPTEAMPRNPYPDAGFLRLMGALLLMAGPKGAFCANQSLIFRKVTGVLMARKWSAGGAQVAPLRAVRGPQALPGFTDAMGAICYNE